MSTSSPETGYHHGDLKRALLEAALEMLDQEGADGVGLRELARKVGVSPAAPYRHFRSRQALLEAVATEGFRRFSAMMAAKEADLPEAEQLPAMAEAYVRFALVQPALFRLMFSPQLKRDERPGLSMAADTAFDTLRHVVGGDVQQGRIKALAAWAKVHGLAVLLLDGQIALRAGEDTEALVGEIISSL